MKQHDRSNTPDTTLASDFLDKLMAGIAEPRPRPADDPRVIKAAIATACVRMALRDAGYLPIPLYDKAPPNRHNNAYGSLPGWQKLKTIPDAVLLQWGRCWPTALSTGVLTREMPTYNVDIRDEAAAVAVEALVRERYAQRGKLLMRIGQPPQRAFPFRTAQPFKKLVINFTARDGGEAEKLEFLGNGQQVVVDGIHPGTGKPYAWFGGTLTEVAHAELPEISQAEAKELMAAAAKLLVRQFGYMRSSNRTRRDGTVSPERRY